MGIHNQDFDRSNKGPLDGIRILDMSRLVAGNMLTLQLADFGGEVIKVESLPNGDPLRAWTENSIDTHWKTYSRNKKSVSINLRDPEGITLFRNLAKTASVVVENFIPGRLEEIGIGPDILLTDNPSLILVRISGFGQTGPYKNRGGFGTLVEAMSGFAERNGFADREPVLPPLALADMVSGLYGAMAVLIAVREIEVKGGSGQIIDLSLLEPIFSILGTDAADFRISGISKQRVGSASNTTSPRNVYPTKDGKWLALSASIQSMTERLFTVIGHRHSITDPRFANNSTRVKHRNEVDKMVGEWVLQHNLDEALAIFEKGGVTAGPVYNIDQFLNDPHILEREVVVDLQDDDMERIPVHNIVPRLSKTPGTFRYPAPQLGQHNEEILTNLVTSKKQFLSLKSRGVIG